MMKDYDFALQYHPGKANVVADALNRKLMALSLQGDWRNCEELISVVPRIGRPGMLMAQISARPVMLDKILEAQDRDVVLQAKKGQADDSCAVLQETKRCLEAKKGWVPS